MAVRSTPSPPHGSRSSRAHGARATWQRSPSPPELPESHAASSSARPVRQHWPAWLPRISRCASETPPTPCCRSHMRRRGSTTRTRRSSRARRSPSRSHSRRSRSTWSKRRRPCSSRPRGSWSGCGGTSSSGSVTPGGSSAARTDGPCVGSRRPRTRGSPAAAARARAPGSPAGSLRGSSNGRPGSKECATSASAAPSWPRTRCAGSGRSASPAGSSTDRSRRAVS